MPSSKGLPSLERSPGKADNWVEKSGGLPDYIERIAKHIHYEGGHSISSSIAAAVNTVKRWAAGGTVKEHGGPLVTKKTQALAAKAVAEWEGKKAASHVTSQGDVEPDLGLSAPIDPSYDLHLAQERLALGLDPETGEALDTDVSIRYTSSGNLSEGAVMLGAGRIIHFDWDPGEHPRDLIGRFKKILGAATPGTTVELPGGTTVGVKDRGGRHYQYVVDEVDVGEGGVMPDQVFNSAAQAAEAALDVNAKSENEESIGKPDGSMGIEALQRAGTLLPHHTSEGKPLSRDDKVRHVDSPDSEAANSVVEKVNDDGTVTIVGPDAEGIGSQLVEGVSPKDLVHTEGPISNDVMDGRQRAREDLNRRYVEDRFNDTSMEAGAKINVFSGGDEFEITNDHDDDHFTGVDTGDGWDLEWWRGDAKIATMHAVSLDDAMDALDNHEGWQMRDDREVLADVIENGYGAKFGGAVLNNGTPGHVQLGDLDLQELNELVDALDALDSEETGISDDTIRAAMDDVENAMMERPMSEDPDQWADLSTHDKFDIIMDEQATPDDPDFQQAYDDLLQDFDSSALDILSLQPGEDAWLHDEQDDPEWHVERNDKGQWVVLFPDGTVKDTFSDTDAIFKDTDLFPNGDPINGDPRVQVEPATNDRSTRDLLKAWVDGDTSVRPTLVDRGINPHTLDGMGDDEAEIERVAKSEPAGPTTRQGAQPENAYPEGGPGSELLDKVMSALTQIDSGAENSGGDPNSAEIYLPEYDANVMIDVNEDDPNSWIVTVEGPEGDLESHIQSGEFDNIVPGIQEFLDNGTPEEFTKAGRQGIENDAAVQKALDDNFGAPLKEGQSVEVKIGFPEAIPDRWEPGTISEIREDGDTIMVELPDGESVAAGPESVRPDTIDSSEPDADEGGPDTDNDGDSPVVQAGNELVNQLLENIEDPSGDAPVENALNKWAEADPNDEDSLAEAGAEVLDVIYNKVEDPTADGPVKDAVRQWRAALDEPIEDIPQHIEDFGGEGMGQAVRSVLEGVEPGKGLVTMQDLNEEELSDLRDHIDDLVNEGIMDVDTQDTIDGAISEAMLDKEDLARRVADAGSDDPEDARDDLSDQDIQNYLRNALANSDQELIAYWRRVWDNRRNRG